MTPLHADWLVLSMFAERMPLRDVWLLHARRTVYHRWVQGELDEVRLMRQSGYTHWQPCSVPPIYADAQPSELDQLRKRAKLIDWSWTLRLLHQGADIHKAFLAGKYPSADDYYARFDAAARERMDVIEASAGTKGEQHG